MGFGMRVLCCPMLSLGEAIISSLKIVERDYDANGSENVAASAASHVHLAYPKLVDVVILSVGCQLNLI